MFKRILFVVLALAIATMACGFNVNLPKVKTPGPDITDPISITAPDAKSASLTLTFGGGTLKLAPGTGSKLVSGKATYNIPDFKPVIKQDGANFEIKEGEYQVEGLPDMRDVKNEWDFKLGDLPMDLSINAGAYDGTFDFGGLSLTSLTIKDGAAQTTADFSLPNKEKMGILTYKTGASNVTLKNLANANAATIVFDSGAGNYTLDFGGSLQRDTSVNIHSGVSNLTLNIPEGLAATVQVTSGLSNVQFPSGWKQNGETYTQTGSGPTLTIIVETGVGNLQITN